MTSPSRIETAPGLTLAYDSYGPPDGEPVIFAHGGGQTRHAWKGAAQALGADGWHAVALDLRGHGDSDWAPDGDYAIESVGADLITLARQMAPDGRAAHTVGASYGGMASLAAAGIVEPGVFASITLVDIVPRMTRDGVEKITGFMNTHAEDGFATLEEAADVIAEYLPHRPRPKNLDGLRKNLRLRDDGRWYWHWDPAFIGKRKDRADPAHIDRLMDAVRAIAVPIHLVRGGSSELVSEEAVAEFREIAPHADYTDVAGARHMVAGDKNDAFIDAVAEFLKKHRQ